MAGEIQERIKCRGRVGIQKRFPQPRLANQADGQVLPLVPGIAETRFPVPVLNNRQIPHFPTQADIEELIPVGELFVSGPVSLIPRNQLRSDRETASVRKEIWDRRICDCERIPWIFDWHTDASGTKIYVRA